MKTIVNAIQHWTKEKIKESTADWNQNDPTAPDYVKNRLAWTDDPVETVLLEETELTFVDGGAELPTPIQLTEGQTYVVTYNGNAYDCTAWLLEEEGIVFIGNGGVIGVSAGNYEPFITDGAVMMSINANASATIRIIEVAAEVHKIDEKYLPKQTHYDNRTMLVDYDGNYEDVISDADGNEAYHYLTSDTFTVEELIGKRMDYIKFGKRYGWPIMEEVIEDINGDGTLINVDGGMVIICNAENTVGNNVTFPYKGLYVKSPDYYGADYALQIYEGSYKQLDAKYLPDNVAYGMNEAIDIANKAIDIANKKTQYFTPSTSEPNQLWFIGESFTPSPGDKKNDLGSDSYSWNKLFLSDGIHTGTKLITCSELNYLSGVTTNIQDAIDNLNTIDNQFTLYTDENRLAFTGQNFTPLNTSKLSNLGDNYNYWNYIFLQGGIYTPSGLIEARNIDQLANLQENVQNKLILLTQGYNELANKIENGTGGGSSSTTAPKVMSIFKPFDTASSTLPYNVAYGQIGFDETSLTPWVYAPYYTYYVTWNGMYLQQTGENMETVNNSTMPDMLSRGYNYLVDDSTDSVYSVFSPGSTSNTMPNTGTLPNTGTVGTIATGEEMSGDLSIYYNASNLRWYPTSGWDTSFLNTNTTYKLCMMEWQPFLQPAETSSF